MSDRIEDIRYVQVITAVPESGVIVQRSSKILQVKFHGEERWMNVRTEELHQSEYERETYLD